MAGSLLDCHKVCIVYTIYNLGHTIKLYIGYLFSTVFPNRHITPPTAEELCINNYGVDVWMNRIGCQANVLGLGFRKPIRRKVRSSMSYRTC